MVPAAELVRRPAVQEQPLGSKLGEASEGQIIELEGLTRGDMLCRVVDQQQG
jgi:hypothetical protein